MGGCSSRHHMITKHFWRLIIILFLFSSVFSCLLMFVGVDYRTKIRMDACKSFVSAAGGDKSRFKTLCQEISSKLTDEPLNILMDVVKTECIKRGFEDVKLDVETGSQSSSFSDISDVEIRQAKKMRRSGVMESGTLKRFLDEAIPVTSSESKVPDYTRQDDVMEDILVQTAVAAADNNSEDEFQMNSEDDRLVFLATTEKDKPEAVSVKEPLVAPLSQIISQVFNPPADVRNDESCGFKLASGQDVVIKNLSRAQQMFRDVENTEFKIETAGDDEDPLKYYTKNK